MSFTTGRAVATVVNPDGPRRRDNREFRASSARDDDADRRWKRRAGGGTESSRLSAVLEGLAGTGDRTRKGRHPKMAAFLKTRRYLVSIPSKQVAGAGFEQSPETNCKTADSSEGDVNSDVSGSDGGSSGGSFDPALIRLLEVWDRLSAEVRDRMVAEAERLAEVPETSSGS